MRFLFIIGSGRCGSTLIEEVVARHPGTGFISGLEANLPLPILGRWNGPLYRRLPAPFSGRTSQVGEPGRRGLARIARLVSDRGLRVAPSEAYRLLNRHVSCFVSAPDRDLTAADADGPLGDRFRRFFESRARAQGRELFVHKFTGWPRASFIHRVFPEARFIHVIRDGRAVVGSLLRMPWWKGWNGPAEWGFGPLPDSYSGYWERSRSAAVLAAIEWSVLIEAAEASKTQIRADLWLDVRYEDFVASPSTETASIMRFVDLPWTEEFGRGFARQNIAPGNSEMWRRSLSDQDQALVLPVLDEHLVRLGYLPD